MSHQRRNEVLTDTPDPQVSKSQRAVVARHDGQGGRRIPGPYGSRGTARCGISMLPFLAPGGPTG